MAAASPHRARQRASAVSAAHDCAVVPRASAAFVVVTGLSGSGKSHAIRALEDLGYFCVDNLPVALIPTFADLTLRAPGGVRRAAVVVDVREGRALATFPAAYRRLKKSAGSQPGRLVFLDAGHSTLLRRFSETRRPHPLALNRTVAGGPAGRTAAARAHPANCRSGARHERADGTRVAAAHSRDRRRHRDEWRRSASRCSASDSATACRRTPTSCSTCGFCRTRTLSRRCGGGAAGTPAWPSTCSRTRTARRFVRLTNGLSAISRAALHRGGQDLSHHRGGMHRWAAPFGRDCRGARRTSPVTHGCRRAGAPSRRRGKLNLEC